MSDICPICSSTLKSPSEGSSHKDHIDCPRCGEFEISDIARTSLEGQLNQLQTVNGSGWIRQYPGTLIMTPHIEMLKKIPTPNVAEKAHRLLLFLSKSFPIAGQQLKFNWSNPSLLSITWTHNLGEFTYLFKDYLYQEKGFLVYEKDNNMYRISPKGWAYIDSLNQINPESRIGFVATWFDEKITPLWIEAIKPGIEAAGYDPIRIDMIQHNNRIDDEIIATIRRSKFLVADFTGQRGGVYFEAGYAQGLGLEVIWLCLKDELREVHFDTRQYNFILWEEDKLYQLKDQLQYRIEATIGRGKTIP